MTEEENKSIDTELDATTDIDNEEQDTVQTETQESNAIETEPLPELDKAEVLAALKSKADLLGVNYHPAIGVDKLREKINIYLRLPVNAKKLTVHPGVVNENDVRGETAEEYSEKELLIGSADSPVKLSPGQMRNDSIADARTLVRVRVDCRNPNKREWPGEIITVANSVVGTFKKFIPFNSPEPYHIPKIILQALRERKCQIFINAKADNGETIKRATLIPEFAIEVLEPLTIEEIRDLAQRQAMASGTQQ